MTEVTALEIPKRPEDMAAMWPTSGRVEIMKTEGYFLVFRDVTIGPFPNRTEAHWYHGMLQDVIMGWNDKELFVGRIMAHKDDEFDISYFIERWDAFDGPFKSKHDAHLRRGHLLSAYNRNVEEFGKEMGDR